MKNLNADYVIVGAGSAGCVLADRLSEDGTGSCCSKPAPATGNTNAPTIMIEEQGAAMIREDAGAARE